MQNIIYQVSTHNKGLANLLCFNLHLLEPVPFISSAAPRNGALGDVAGDVLRDLPDVVDEREVEQEVPRILALVAAKRANRR